MIRSARIFLIAAIVVPTLGGTGGAPAAAQILAQLPAWPASVAAAAAAANTASAAVLEKQLLAAQTQSGLALQHQAYAGTALDMGTDPAQMQAKAAAMAKQMASMSDAQKMAYAMQMQAQMQQSTTMAAVPNAAESAAMRTLGAEQQASQSTAARVSAAQQKMNAILSRYQDQQHSLDDERIVKLQALNSRPGKANCKADWQQRHQLDQHYADQHVAVARQMLAAMQPVYAEQKTLATTAIDQSTAADKTVAVIKNPAMLHSSGAITGMLRNNGYAALLSPIQAYDAATQEAQRWQTQRTQVYAVTTPNCS
ncbi:MAG: hypothetical protein ACRESS_11090 [Stenotrophobium sp.]